MRDEGEEGLAGWRIEVYPFIRETDASYPDAGAASSGADGSFRIENLDVSWPTWHLHASLWQGSVFDHYYRVDLPQPYAFSFKGDLMLVDIPVAFDEDTEVTFHVWEDFDGDGVVSAADELALWTDVVIETPEGTRVFAPSGPVTSLTLTGLLPGEYLARATTDPLNGVPFAVERGVAQAPLELLMKPQITFYGYVYEDANENGVRDSGEPGLAGAAIEVETRSPDTSIGSGTSAGQEGSYVLAYGSVFADREAYVGCSYFPVVPPEEQNDPGPRGFWRGALGMTSDDHAFWFLPSPIVVREGVYRYPVDCGLVYQPPQPPIIVVAPVSGDGIGLPYSGSGGGGSEMSWAALALAGVGVLLIAGTTRARWKRPDPCGPGPRSK